MKTSPLFDIPAPESARRLFLHWSATPKGPFITRECQYRVSTDGIYARWERGVWVKIPKTRNRIRRTDGSEIYFQWENR